MQELQQSKERLAQLDKRKVEIEAAIAAQNEILDANGVGMDEPLVDNDGFPRSDIDVYKVRHARHQIICLLNDHKALMKDVERALHDHHAQISRNGAGETREEQELIAEVSALKPFAVVGNVENGSPAQTAGLMSGDKIVKFGSVSAGNFRDVMDVAAVVRHSVGQPVNLYVKRGSSTVPVVLTPKPWHGRGLLGCAIVPEQ
ncbi:hypothetical protein HPB48_010532 [Haemaphysalis longicornis]|uniref:26S proteasome non-ATPase regulatory subunit 9 n=1 Tax=Haemaphysalis longicornis TaxID=44386 RepID=A0A9J6H3X9_HAELO|nr:hypothetical protein HPB48_010532 [Haemaphysalis longicornis]